MSTRERVHKVVDSLSEEQLHAFLIIFENTNNDENNRTVQKKAAFKDMQSILQRIPPVGDIDEKAELAAYRDERYGEGL